MMILSVVLIICGLPKVNADGFGVGFYSTLEVRLLFAPYLMANFFVKKALLIFSRKEKLSSPSGINLLVDLILPII